MDAAKIVCFLTSIVLTSSLLGAQDVTFTDARVVFETHCFQCHGKDGSKKGGMDFILDPLALRQEGKVEPGKPEESPLYARMVSGERPMPPRDAPSRPSQKEIETVRRWIEAGAKVEAAKADSARPEVSLVDHLELALELVQREFEGNRRNLRFLNLEPLHNLPAERITKDDLNLLRLAVIKLLNSLSWRGDLLTVMPLGKEGTLLAIDLSELSWSGTREWREIEKLYPYGLHHESAPVSADVRSMAKELYELTGTLLPIIRADWFVATASRPPLYHTLLGIPETDHALEQRLQVQVGDNLKRGRALRSGFTKSGVSEHNRLVERHRSATGGYWKSYDFKSSAGEQNLVARPLGPEAHRDQFPKASFRHDGGEIIFSLPNGLQGYMLVDAAGRRIDAGPIDVVHDDNRTSGNPTVVNGLSCMACHSQGMIDLPSDLVGRTHALQGTARDLVNRLYPGDTALAFWVQSDRRKFQGAVERAFAPLLGAGQSAATLPEPVSTVARRFQQDLDLDAAASELGVGSQMLLEAIRNDSNLERQGLGPLTQDSRIKRETWEGLSGLQTTFQVVALRLNVGTPVRVSQ